jgi:hypothetical protein
MRTAVTIDDLVYEAARHQAEALHVPLGEFIQTAMKQALLTPPPVEAPPFRPPHICSGLREGLAVESASSAVDEGER